MLKVPKAKPLIEKKEDIKKSGSEEEKGLQKDAFLYMEAKGSKDFPQCKNCWKFTGSTCLEFGKNDEVKPEATCGLYNQGTPRKDLKGQESGGTTKEIAGYLDKKVTCSRCHYFAPDGDCLLFRILGIKDYKVKPDSCCNAFSEKHKE